MQTVKVKNIEIGQGMPKICIPVTGKNEGEILKELEMIEKEKPDLAEWRVDCYEEGDDGEKTWEMLKTISDRLGEIPLLFTFRSAGEGGMRQIRFEDYVNLLVKAAKTKSVDMIDVEAFFSETDTSALIKALKAEDVVVLASNHHFDRTPKKEEILERLKKMEACGADILKVAVMPENSTDLFTLLDATACAVRECAKPIVTMSMGETGVLSRVCGEFTGSAMTFASGIKASAPGQIPSEKLRKLLEDIHEVKEG